MKKIGILTFHASHNYGSMLQAYALSFALKELGHSVEIINFRSIPQKMFYIKPHKYWDLLNIKSRLLFPVLFFKTIKKWKNFESFMKTEMPITCEIYYYADIKKLILENGYNAVITGSDQIWNLNCADFSVGYLLPFKLPCKKIAFAPSMGQLQYLQVTDAELLFKSTLSDYDFLSVREPSTAEALSNLLQKSVSSIPDPTWLIPLDVYDKMSFNRPIVKGEYLFYYKPHFENKGSEEIYELSRKLGLKAVCSNTQSSINAYYTNISDAGPREFLNLIKFAKFVCGYSMHLIIFALIFHKPFFAVLENQDTRIVDLLKYFGLENRIVSVNKILDEYNIEDIDWKNVDAKISKFRSIAINYLLETLKD